MKKNSVITIAKTGNTDNYSEYELQYLPAALVTEELPHLYFGKLSVSRIGDSWKIITKSGEERYGEIEKAVFVQCGPGDIDIISLSDPSAREYTVFIAGVTKMNMVDYFS